MSERKTLNQIVPKQRCKVVNVHTANGFGQRLMEMGLIQGSILEVVRFAPLGDPMEIRVGSYRLSVRKADAAQIEVELCP